MVINHYQLDIMHGLGRVLSLIVLGELRLVTIVVLVHIHNYGHILDMVTHWKVVVIMEMLL